MDDPLLSIENLSVCYRGRTGYSVALDNLSFSLGRERLGIVGESGSGKSTIGRAILGVLPDNARMSAQSMKLGQTDLTRLGEDGYRSVRGRRISMILQDPKYSLNPVVSVGDQIAESYRIHKHLGRREARRRALEMLDAVRIADPERVYGLYPHNISGGMGQRVMIAMMLVPDPEILIADEPTSALDVSVQAQFLSLIDDMVRNRNMGLILISHDLNLVANFCDRVMVLYGGQVMEVCEASQLSKAEHPYTRALLSCRPMLGVRHETLPQMIRDPAWLKRVQDR